ncbi:MAG: prepilin-type N-terminal cleavage/methylation domain-containing protein [Alphaproteobacteria bacterium]|nr:prepilin-type N-terminal cleavage/methylation domain-containing protein [Alphaproteobacteria bacterium]
MKKLHKLRGQKGFTLVELAIVLVIIGLLIGGILKGQQLIDNARVTAQMSQFQSVQAATTSFQDAYAALPGDMLNVANRVPNIGACAAGDGNGIVGIPGGTPNTDSWQKGSTGENLCFWAELSGAGYLTGIAQPDTAVFGQGLPQAKLGAGLVVADLTTAPWSGLYVVTLQSTQNSQAAAGVNSMTPAQAAQIDRKMDDGNPTSGSILGAGDTANCGNGANVANASYLEKSTTKDCDISFKLQ